MSNAAVEAHCLSLPRVTLEHPFAESNVFKAGGKKSANPFF
ncbi:MAG: hypothetical protein ACREHE_04350 [Rhizomicrobium sp.]